MAFKTATVNASDVPATLTNYPSYIDWSRLGITTLAEAQSSRVYADSGKVVEWAREVVSATEGHTKVPSLTSTTPIYVDYDGIRADYAVTDTYGRNAVWSAYDAVYHLGSTADSTGNARTLTDSGVVYTTGKIGDGSDHTRTDKDQLYRANWVGAASSGLTMEFWLRNDAQPVSGYSHTVQFGGGSSPYVSHLFNYQQYPTSTYTLLWGRVRNGVTNSHAISVTQTLTVGTWYHFVCTTNGSTADFYKDGSSIGSASTNTLSGSSGAATSPNFTIGRENYAGDDNSNRYTEGMFDEVRIRQTGATANEVTTTYNNQSDESGFWGTWTDAGGGVTRRVFVVS